MLVNVKATRAGVPYTFTGVMVNSIAELTGNYASAGFTIDGYTVVDASTPAPIFNPPAADIVTALSRPSDYSATPRNLTDIPGSASPPVPPPAVAGGALPFGLTPGRALLLAAILYVVWK